MSWRITLADVRITEAQRAAALEVLDSGWLSMGPRTAAFEAAFADASGTSNAVCVANATAGLLLALQAVGVGPGDEVVVPSFTFVADANVVVALGATPVFADIVSIDRPIVDVDDILAAITDKTRAVIVVHYGGHRVDIAALASLQSRGIAVIEDASHAVGPASDDGRWLPFLADAAVFSFFANKNLATGEGGMLTTADPELASRVRLLRGHGMTTGTWDRHEGHASEYDVVLPGWNFRPTELTAALGSTGLEVLPEHNRRRRHLLSEYRRRVAAVGGEALGLSVVFSDDDPTTGHLCVVRVPRDRRAGVRRALSDDGIQSSFHYPPIHRFTAYRHLSPRALPHTEAATAELVTLPLHPWLDESDVAVVVDGVMAALSPAAGEDV